jgi:hypothetical protein
MKFKLGGRRHHESLAAAGIRRVIAGPGSAADSDSDAARPGLQLANGRMTHDARAQAGRTGVAGPLAGPRPRAVRLGPAAAGPGRPGTDSD